MHIRFAPWLTEEQQGEIRDVLRPGLTSAQRILPGQSRVKAFYRVEAPSRPLFVKVRRFPSWPRRLGRSLRQTKEEREFQNFLLLRERGIPCPEPLAAVRKLRSFVTTESLLVTEYLAEARSLRQTLTHADRASRHALLDALLVFLGVLVAKEIVHEDLQWNNVLVRPAGRDPGLYLVDALHVRVGRNKDMGAFHHTLAWFLHFMISEGADDETCQGFLVRAEQAGLTGPSGAKGLLARAQGMRTGR